MTVEIALRREQGLWDSVDMMKYKALKMAEEYAALSRDGLKLAADMAKYITQNGQKGTVCRISKTKRHRQREVIGVGLLDISGFEDLLEMQAERSEPAEKLIPVPKTPLTEKVRLARIKVQAEMK